ncbi:unnamed protein product [Vicia faba]|uniref:HMA domain-containing protein n=1 Tax=Vicia faba TaxID=3906 RepID=A0AAV1B0Z6_VICFA|nr:unnamed protein product [Vicia faba]
MAAPKPPPPDHHHQQLPPASETLKYQTWVLKVLIHCDGCTKRIKKILQGIEGVYTTEVDSMQHKVTVTGNVEAETLIKKLSRSGKSVELWPEKPPEKKDKKPSTKSKEDQKNGTEPVGESGHDHEDCIDDVGDDGGEEDSNHNDGDTGGGDNKSEGGAKKKKKKKKNRSGSVTSVPLNNDGGEKVIISTEKIVSPNEIIVPPVLQQQRGYGYNNPYPPHMYYSHTPLAHAPPPYGLSYNTSYPVNTTSGYYVGGSIMPMHANYSRAPPPPPPPSGPINNYGYHHDHDEYEGGYCSIM